MSTGHPHPFGNPISLPYLIVRQNFSRCDILLVEQYFVVLTHFRTKHASGGSPSKNVSVDSTPRRRNTPAGAPRLAVNGDNMEKDKELLCEKQCVHEDIIKKVMQVVPDEESLFEAAELLKVFGDSTRIRIIFVLCQSEMCVCDIAKLLGMTQSAISHQLRVLKQARLVKSRRDGKTIFYSIADEHVKTIFYYAMEHVME